MIPQARFATERSEKHGPDLEVICCRDADCARDGKGHYQAEQNFRNPFNGFEYPVG